MKIQNKLIGALIIIMMTIGFAFVINKTTSAATSVNLGQAGSFAVLAGTAVTNVPTSSIKWDVGLSPAAGSNYAGLTSPEVGGTIFTVDNSGPAGSISNAGLLTAAKADLVSAYDALSAGDNTSCDITYAGTRDLAGLALPAGVYCADDFMLSGTLNLTGTGVWIFRSGSTLVTTEEANIVGGDPCNVWWKVPSSATLGTNTSLIGNILALTSITMESGARLNGRALARNGAVTLDNNVINNELCAVAYPTTTVSENPIIGSTTSPTRLPSTGISSRNSEIYWLIAIMTAAITLPLSLATSRKK